MNWEQVKGNVKQVGDHIKEKWNQVTDEDLRLLTGKRDVFLARLQQRTGLTQEEVERQFDNFMEDFDVSVLENR